MSPTYLVLPLCNYEKNFLNNCDNCDKHASLLRSRINYARKIVVVYVHNRYKQETYEKDHKEKSVFAVSRTGERPNYYYCLFINQSGYKKTRASAPIGWNLWPVS